MSTTALLLYSLTVGVPVVWDPISHSIADDRLAPGTETMNRAWEPSSRRRTSMQPSQRWGVPAWWAMGLATLSLMLMQTVTHADEEDLARRIQSKEGKV